MTEPREAPVRRQTSLTTCRVSTVRSCTATAFHRPKFFSVGLFSFTILYFIIRSPYFINMLLKIMLVCYYV
ncbi:MAG: hypothetical protein J5506_09170 [Prevotella sp.]|nr:hypothetical protein [Prevotella sp.]